MDVILYCSTCEEVVEHTWDSLEENFVCVTCGSEIYTPVETDDCDCECGNCKFNSED